MKPLPLAAGSFVLALAWIGAWADLPRLSFSAHMVMHMGVVAVGAPLIAIGIAGSRADPARRFPTVFAAIPASFLELIVVWAWHAPALHHAARHDATALVAEQGSFVVSGLFLWLSVLGGDEPDRRGRASVGIVALVLTFGHMTLLGALLMLTPRPLYHDVGTTWSILSDQQAGGAIMVLVGAVSYLSGALWLTTRVLEHAQAEAPRS
jgi:putative membrane protein